MYSPTVRAVPRSVYFMYGSASFFSETNGNKHPELPRRLACFSPVGGQANNTQIRAPQPPRAPGTQGQFCQELTVPQLTHLIPGGSFRLNPDEGYSLARACSGHSAAPGLFQTWSPSFPQIISEVTRPYGLCLSCTTAGPAKHATPTVLAEASGSTSRLAA